MFLRCVSLSFVLMWTAKASIVVADTPPHGDGHKTIEELFAAYTKATESRDWKSLFLLSTRERQDSEVLMIAVSAAVSNDATLRSLVEKHGGNWKQFDHTWSEADNERFKRDFPSLAASFGKRIAKKPELFAMAKHYIDSKGDPSSTKVQKLDNVVHHDPTAVGESVERRTCVERQYDGRGNEIARRSAISDVRSRLWFRQINGCWFLATEHETVSVSTPRTPQPPNISDRASGNDK